MKAGKAIKNVEVFHKKSPLRSGDFNYKNKLLCKLYYNLIFGFFNLNHIEFGKIFSRLVPFFS